MTRAPFLSLVAALGLGTACEPPPPIDLGDVDTDTDVVVEPASIEIVYPPADVGTWALDADCHVRMPVAIDLDHFLLVDFREVEEANLQLPTEGHWHVTFDLLDFYATVLTQATDVDFYNVSNPTLAKGLASTGSTMLLGASLRHSDHSAVGCASCEAQVELTLTDPTNCVPAE